MSKKSLKYLPDQTIEAVTEKRIREFEKQMGRKIAFPIPVELIVEQILDLTLDYDEIEEHSGEQILGGLIPEERKIMINEKHSQLFTQKPGLERSTIAHEAGHWDIDIDRSTVGYPCFPGFQVKCCTAYRHSKKTKRLVEVIKLAATDDRAYKMVMKLTAGQDSPEVRNAVDRYQAALLMPKWLIFDARNDYDFTKWPDLYALAELAQVTISNLTNRLQRLGLIFVPENSKEIFRSKHEFGGQQELF